MRHQFGPHAARDPGEFAPVGVADDQQAENAEPERGVADRGPRTVPPDEGHGRKQDQQPGEVPQEADLVVAALHRSRRLEREPAGQQPDPDQDGDYDGQADRPAAARRRHDGPADARQLRDRLVALPRRPVSSVLWTRHGDASNGERPGDFTRWRLPLA
jgi:hypothetical protein